MQRASILSRSKEGVLTLTQLPGVGQKAATVLAREYLTLEEIRRAASKGRPSSLAGRAWRSLGDELSWDRAFDHARRVIEQAERLNVQILTAFDDEFPALLRSIPESPLVLFVKGQLRGGLRNVACVGTREPSAFGLEVTRRLVSFLTENGWGIVSGLARGIDAEAHRSAIDRNGYTVAVLANGLEKIYPSENQRLAEEILERGGALISEQPFGVPPRPVHLVQRDRLQSGMAMATFVMQTDLEGGTMHTVRYTLCQRRLLVVPVPRGRHAQEPKSRGLIALTESTGATLAGQLKVNEEYRNLLVRRFRDTPPAYPLRSRADYGTLLRHLAERVACEEKSPGGPSAAYLFGQSQPSDDIEH